MDESDERRVVDAMRWDGLFDDLEAQAAALQAADRSAEVDDRTRGEFGEIAWADRVRSVPGSPVRVRVRGAAELAGQVQRVGPDWLLLADPGTGREWVVPLPAVHSVRGVGRYFASEPSRVAARLGLRHVLRGIARDRSAVRVTLTDGEVLDGTIDRVGADFCEVATHAAGEARRRSEVRDVTLVAFAGIAVVARSV